MKAVVQRVKKASVTIDGKVISSINVGLLVLVAVAELDTDEIISWFANKLANLRVFDDEDGKMNKSLLDVKGELMIVSNFTVYGETKKGFRPSFSNACKPETAKNIYNKMLEYIKTSYNFPLKTGEFGAKMDVELVNDGPVTLIIEKKSIINIGE
jgi:D-aminoacyl-tRNA deacylase